MQSSPKPLLPRKKNLLLCLDAFGTLFAPSTPIPIAYARAAARHGLAVGDTEHPSAIATSFKQQFKRESQRNPNYGKATGLGAEQWWTNIIRGTFTPFLRPGQSFPPALATELLHRYSSREGYDLFDDVRPLFETLRGGKQQQRCSNGAVWPWDRTVVGIITNSDSRVPGILESFGLRVGHPRFGTTTDEKSAGREGLVNDIDFVVLSYDVGVEKPHANMFRAAEALGETVAGLENSTLDQQFDKLYVGDEVEKDYFAARQAGWGAVLLQRPMSAHAQLETGKGVERVGVKGKDGKTSLVDAVSSLSELAAWQPNKA
ncbi:haloacid dehalogenase [Stemphylium lycopersici]|uniref:Haloacid dehalogenase n=1 Tax=Stemphylium lycopersici TaxID=183478 RepID=A0A364MUA2_STELY|nr:haloacid dehalogenase [Stemphylium lycopersici]RAQ99270.1 haloacid dehalogenase [Stemphylium lycopersici]RAR03654.1 haloacid dehalogenase [Stemphylium lycopersici]